MILETEPMNSLQDTLNFKQSRSDRAVGLFTVVG